METGMRDVLLGLGLVLLAALGVFVAIPLGIDEPGEVDFLALSPGFWPLIVTIALGCLGALVAFEGFLGRQAPNGAEGGPGREPSGGADFAMRTAATILALFILYFAIGYLGMVAASICVIMALTMASGERRFKYTVPVAVILPIGLYYFFVYVAGVPMPLGVFETLL